MEFYGVSRPCEPDCEAVYDGIEHSRAVGHDHIELIAVSHATLRAR